MSSTLFFHRVFCLLSPPVSSTSSLSTHYPSCQGKYVWKPQLWPSFSIVTWKMMLYHICPKLQPPSKISFTFEIFQSFSLFEKNTKTDAIIWWYLECQNNREWSEGNILSIPHCSQLSQKEERAGRREEGRGKWCFRVIFLENTADIGTPYVHLFLPSLDIQRGHSLCWTRMRY